MVDAAEGATSVKFTTDYPDKVVVFDRDEKWLSLVDGEQAFYMTRNVVDVQQTQLYTDPQVQGVLTVTNLRLVFSLERDTRRNISIGYAVVQKILVGNIDPQPGIQTTIVQQDRTLVVVCTDPRHRYRFEFLPRGSRQIFDILQTVYRAYDTSRAFRTTRTRSALGNHLLPNEYVAQAFPDVQMISQMAPQPVPGMFQLTNLRIIWYATQQSQLNVLAPYIDVSQLQLQRLQLKPGGDLTIEDAVAVTVSQPDDPNQQFTVAFNGFSISNKLLFDKIQAAVQAQRSQIDFGVHVQPSEDTSSLFQGKTQHGRQTLFFSDTNATEQDQKQLYGAVAKKQLQLATSVVSYIQERRQSREIVYDEELGLAFERSEVPRAELM